MEEQSYQGENIAAARQEDRADPRFAGHGLRAAAGPAVPVTTALDVDADIEVLETMMAKDGLVTPKGADIRSVMEMK